MRFLVFIIIFICNRAYSQSHIDNFKDVKFEIKFSDYTNSMLNGDYRNAINQIHSISKNQELTNDELYNLSCSYIRINLKDSSLYFLNIYLDKFHIDPYFSGDLTYSKLWGQPEWIAIINNAKIKYNIENQNLLHPTIEFELQKFKGEDQSTISGDSILFSTFHNRHIDYINNEIADSKINEISRKGLEAILLFIMHDENLKLQKRYFKIFKNLAQNNKVDWEDVCTLHDKILIKSGKKQLYGTQWHYDKTTRKSIPYPIRNIENIEKRRKSKNFDFTFKQYNDFQNLSITQ